jgi:O-antigen/teichoic acid export membrane protein
MAVESNSETAAPSAARSWLLGAASAAGINGASMAAFFAGQLVLVRLLGPAGFGEYIYALVWVMALVPFAASGVQDSAVRFVPAYLSNGESGLLRGYSRFALILSLAGPVALAAALAAVTWLLRDRIGTELSRTFLVAWLVLTPATCASFYQSVLRGIKRIGWALLPLDVLRPMITAGGAWLAVTQFGMPASPAPAMGITVGAFVAVAVFSAILARRFVASRKTSAPREYQVREWLQVSWHMMGISAVLLAMNRADAVILGFWYEKDVVGIYVTAWQLASTLAMAMTMSSTIAAPLIAEYHAAGALAKLQKSLLLSARITFLAALGALLAIVLLGRWILGIFDPVFVAGYPVLLILCCAQLCHVVAGPAGFLMTLTGHHRAASRIAAISGVLCILLNLLFIPLWGPIGAAVANTIAALVWRTTEIVYVRKTVGVNPSIF